MDQNKKEELKLDLFNKEYDSVAQAIRTLFLAGEKVIALGVTIIVAGLSYGIKEKVYDLLLFLPFAFFGVLFYGIHIFVEIMSLGGYKRFWEERINIAFDENILLWELFISKGRHRFIGRIFLYIIYMIFLGFTILISLRTAHEKYTDGTFWGILIGILFFSIGLIIVMYKSNKAFDRTYQIAKHHSKAKTAVDK